MKLGLKAPRPGAIPLRLATYVDWAQMPSPPTDFGHYPLIPPEQWGALGNNDFGDCAIAGPCHQVMLWTKEAGDSAPFNDQAALRNYGDITGFDPGMMDDLGNNPSDAGTDIGAMANYWLHTGLVDMSGKRHRIVAVCDMNPGDLRELWLATYLFQSVGMGFALPDSAIDQTQNGQAWDVVPGATIAGGHYVPNFGRASRCGVGLSWGVLQPFTAQFYQTYNDQGIVALSEEMMVKAKSIDGFDDTLLRNDMAAFRNG